VTKAAAVTVCQPLDLAASSYIADHIMVILTGFAEQSKVILVALLFKSHTHHLIAIRFGSSRRLEFGESATNNKQMSLTK